MGRELRRVPLDFNWPWHKVWHGYLNPYHSTKCPYCDGTGYSPQAKVFSEQWYGDAPFDPVAYGAKPLSLDNETLIAVARFHVERSPGYYMVGYRTVDEAVRSETMRLWKLFGNQWMHHLIQEDVDALVKAERLWDFTRVPRTPEQEEIVKKKIADGGNSWLPESNGYVPTAQEVNDWSLHGLSHDGCNMYACLRARCEREGIASECSRCHGSGELWQSPELKKLHEEWKEVEPPKGDGYQLWETTSEGSPVSPVFPSLDELCAWCAKHATTFARFKATKEDWRKMLDADCVCHQEGGNIFM